VAVLALTYYYDPGVVSIIINIIGQVIRGLVVATTAMILTTTTTTTIIPIIHSLLQVVRTNCLLGGVTTIVTIMIDIDIDTIILLDSDSSAVICLFHLFLHDFDLICFYVMTSILSTNYLTYTGLFTQNVTANITKHGIDGDGVRQTLTEGKNRDKKILPCMIPTLPTVSKNYTPMVRMPFP